MKKLNRPLFAIRASKIYLTNFWSKMLGSVTPMLIILLLISSGISHNTHAQYYRASGTQIVGPNNEAVFFSGMNLGNWLLWEGYLMMGDFNYRTHTQFLNSLRGAFGGNQAQAEAFQHEWRMNYVTNQTIVDLKNLGFNSVRVPFHYNMFWNGSTVTNHGFQYFDRLIGFCRANGVSILLDMHAAPGYQNPGDHSDNMASNASQPRNTVQFWDGNNINIASQVWRHIAARYANEPIIWGYDLINEPVPQPGREFELLNSMITMRNAIRQVDNNHIIVAEGSWWGSDMQKLDWLDPTTQSATGVRARWDANLVYQTHHYSTDVSALDGRLAICNKLGVPLILGEYGEMDDATLRRMTDWAINNRVGYFPWSFKKMSHDKCLWTIQPNSAYNAVKNYINNGGTPPANAYNDMIAFCRNNIANGSPGITFHQSWYNAVKPNTPPPPPTRFPIPGTIQAEGFSGQSGLQTETTTDTGGGQNIGWIEVGDWADYLVNVQTAGNYNVQYRVASTGTTGQVQLRIGTTTYATTNIPNTGGWQTWVSVSATAALPAGQHTIRLYFSGAGFNVNWFSFTTGTGGTIPSVPTNLSASAGNGQASLTWTASSGVTSYTVKRATTNGGPYTNVATGITSTSYTNTGLTNGTTYYYVVSAVNSAGSSANSNQVSATPSGTTTGIVSGGIYRINSVLSGKALDVTDVSTANGALIQQWDWTNGNNQKWKLVSLGGGLYSVSAMNGGNKFLDVAGVSTADGAAIQQWDWANGGNQKWTIADIGGGVYRFTASHSGKVLHIGSTANGAKLTQATWNNTNNQKWTIQYLGTTVRLVDEEAVASNLNLIYPNPVRNKLNVENFEALTKVEVISINSAFQVNYQRADFESGTLNVSQLKAGMYILKLTGKDGKVTIRNIIKE